MTSVIYKCTGLIAALPSHAKDATQMQNVNAVAPRFDAAGISAPCGEVF